MSDESSGLKATSLAGIGGLQGALAFFTGGLWIEGSVPIVVPVAFALSGLALVLLGRIERMEGSGNPDWLKKSRVSETHDEDPREERKSRGDGSVRPGESVSQDDLEAIADEHDVNVIGVDQSSDGEITEDDALRDGEDAYKSSTIDKSGESSDE